ncbi:MAG: hypothetical protein DRO05_08350 [Thermoproteota archaeon]|nr:MAG: hypothetical protein DRO05_08350 [Candidatus Korarchaeota archaeon]
MGGRRISHDLRVELRKRVLELRASGLSYKRIQMAIKEEYGIDLSKSNISYWVRGIHIPEREAYNKPDFSKKEEISWLAGIFVGDGSINVSKEGKKLRLKVKDRELAEEASRVFARVMGREKPYAVGRLSDGRYYVEVRSRELADRLLQRNFILMCMEESPLEFLKAFFDCEGSITAFINAYGRFVARIEIANTDLELLKRILTKLEEIGIRGRLVIAHRKGKVLVSSRGRITARKDCYSLTIYKIRGIIRFARVIGSSIPRKREKYEKFLLSRR